MNDEPYLPDLPTRRATLARLVALAAAAQLANAGAAAAPAVSAASATAAAPKAPDDAPARNIALPAGLVWQTNNEDPLIGSEHALRGGTLRFAIASYPLTFRLIGPNSNDAFASWNRLFTMNFGLVQRHPVSDRFIPMLATHWAIQPDRRTIYFKLDPDARFSDGHPVTARDFVFTLTMMRSKHIVDPFYNTYAEQYYESVDAVDEHTLRIVGKRESWRPLSDYAGLWPTPEHVTTLDAGWVKRSNNEFQVAVGPYTVTKAARGESLTLQRVAKWWGDGKRYFRGQYNFEQIELRVIPPERMLDYLRRGEIDLMTEQTARSWHENYDFPAVNKGWLRRARVMVDTPSGMSGLCMNLQAPIFRNRDFRQAMQYLFDFERVNRDLMFDEYFRMTSFFEGTPYANPNLVPYGFSPSRAREALTRAGYRRPAELRGRGIAARAWNVLRGLVMTRSNDEDVLVNERGEKASFTVIYGSQGLERHLTVIQQDYRRAGVDMRLRLLEGGTAFARGLERKYEMTMTNRTSGFYPDPRQYFGSEFKNATNNNDIWGFGSPEVDALIKTYEHSLVPQERLDALHRIDQIVHDEAFYIPFWSAPFIRIVHWDYLCFPEFYLPKRTEQLTDYLVYWIDPARRSKLEKAQQSGEAFAVDPVLDKDYYHLRAASARAAS